MEWWSQACFVREGPCRTWHTCRGYARMTHCVTIVTVPPFRSIIPSRVQSTYPIAHVGRAPVKPTSPHVHGSATADLSTSCAHTPDVEGPGQVFACAMRCFLSIVNMVTHCGLTPLRCPDRQLNHSTPDAPTSNPVCVSLAPVYLLPTQEAARGVIGCAHMVVVDRQCSLPLRQSRCVS